MPRGVYVRTQAVRDAARNNRYKGEDFSGRKFGLLTVIRQNGRDTNGSLWLCNCDCGATVSLTYAQLYSKIRQFCKRNTGSSCGCLSRYEDLSGKKFDRLTVIKQDGEDRHGIRLWLCLCDCGNTTTVRIYRTNRGQSCGCKKHEYNAKRHKDLLGMRFGRLAVQALETVRDKFGRCNWSCLCDCGKVVSVSSSNLVIGHTRSCGCLLSQVRGDANRTHGCSGKRITEYNTWKHIHQRCNNPKNNAYRYYGGLGVTVSPLWQGKYGFETFLKDVGPKPEPKELYSADRWPNPSGNYEPSNFRWATVKEQANNKRGQQAMAQIADLTKASGMSMEQLIQKFAA